MRKHLLKKILSITLGFIMAFTMLFVPLGAVSVYADATNSVWTELADIDAAAAAEQPVAVTMTATGTYAGTYALTATSSSAGPLAKGADISAGGELSIAGDKDTYGWTVTKTENNGTATYTFMNKAGDFLYMTATNNGMRVGQKPQTGGDWYIVSAAGSDGQNFDYLSSIDSNGTERYLGVYQSSNWRCYGLTNTGAFPTNIKDQTLQFWVYDRDEEGQEATISPISDALAANSGEFTVKGVVTFVDNRNIYIQDETGGICLFFAAAPTDISLGDTLVGSGNRTSYNGLPELGNAQAVKQTEDTLELTPVETTIGAITAADVCTYVSISGLTVDSIDGDNTRVKDDSGASMPIYRAVTGSTTLKAGDKINFTGAVGIFSNSSGTTLQLRNSVASEITVTSTGPDDPPGPVTGDTFGLASTIADGDEVIIYNAASGMAVGNQLNGYKINGVSLKPEKGVINTDNEAAVWKVAANADGTYTFTQGDYTLGGVVSGNFNNLVVSDAAFTGWKLSEPDTSDFTYFMQIDGMTASQGNVYLEYYSGYTLYASSNPDKTAFGINFYKKGADPETPDTPPAPSGDKFGLASTIADGDEVIIYNAASKMALGNTISSSKISGVSFTPADGVITTDKEAVVWTVQANANGTYTFKQGDYVLGGVANGTRGNLVLTEGEHTEFTLDGPDQADFNYFAKFADWSNNYGNFYLEYYSGFTVYSTGTPDKDAYGITFYKKGAEAEVPQGDGPEPEDGDLVKSLDELTDGQTIAIYNRNHKTAASTKPNGDWYLKAKEATITSEGKLDQFTSDYVWIVKINEDGTYSFYSYDEYTDYPVSSITVWKSGTYAEVCTDSTQYPNNKWILSPAATANSFYFSSPAVSSENGNAYLEAYTRSGSEVFRGNFIKTTSSSFNEGRAAMQIYKVDAADAIPPYDDGVWDGVLTPGQKYMIYNTANEKALGLFREAEYSLEPIDASLEGEPAKIKAGNGAYVFTVESMGRYYAFKAGGRYLASNNAEDLFLLPPLEGGGVPETAKWYLSGSQSGGYLIYNKDANYNGTPVCIEFFSSAFSGWTYKSSDEDQGKYFFNFYEPVEGTKTYEDVVQDPTVSFDSKDSRCIDQDYPVTVTLNDLCDDITNVAITFTAGSKTGTIDLDDPQACEVSSDKKIYEFTIPAAAIDSAEAPESFTINVDATNSYGISYSGTKNIDILDEPFIEDVKPDPGTQTGEDKRPVISAKIGNYGENPVITLKLNDEEMSGTEFNDGVFSFTPQEDLEDGRKAALIEVTRSDGVTASKIWNFTVGDADYQLYFGQLHSHTTYSDGSGSLETALDYIASLPESSNIQFVAFTDHSNYFDAATAANPEAALNDKNQMTPASKARWEEYKAQAEAFNNAHKGDDLLAIAGFEMTWSGGPGHINTFDSDGLVSRNNAALNNKSGDAGMKLYYQTVNQGESLNQFNHPGTTFGNFTDFSYWDKETDDHFFLVEVGNGEGPIGQGGYYPSYEQYTLALDKGWHIAPTNNQDNHKGRWGNANDARDVVLTNDFSEAGIYDAIRNLRVYSTEDKNLKVGYTVNGDPMGTIYSEPPKELEVEVTTYDPDEEDKITKVELISNGGKVVETWDKEEDLSKGYFTATIDPDFTYYYVRVTQKDKDLAVTAPVWTGKSVSMDIKEVKAAPDPAIVGEAMTFTTTLENMMAEAATVKSITYSIGSNVIGTDTTARTLPKEGTLDVEYSYTPTVAKRTTVTVTAVLNVGGNDYTFTKDVTFAVRENSEPLAVTPISTVRAQTEEGYEFAIEGIVTSNASGYDKDTAFFDCIYVQDDTAGLCCFPVSGEYKIGDKVKIEGYTEWYQGEPELQVQSIEVIGTGTIEPTVVTAAQITDRSVEGKLVTLNGTVESFEVENGLIQTIMVKDSAGEVARVFIDGYITTANEVVDCEVGATISATGLASYDDTFNAPDGPFPRIRIKDRADIVCAAPVTPEKVAAEIEALPDPEKVTANDEAAIEKALADYNSLTAEEQALLPAGAAEKLTAAKAKLDAAKAQEAAADAEAFIAAVSSLANNIVESAVTGYPKSDYTASTYGPYAAAYEAAQAVINKADATTAEIQAADAALAAAKEALVKKAANPLKVKGKTVKVKAKTVKKKAVKITAKKALTVSKAQGKVTYKKTKGNKKITVAKNGKITVKKGLKKGTYSIKVKVTAAGNDNYRPGSKTVTVKIKVK